ncbi:MAG: rRNA (uracil1498-N3)-methyltransferase [Acidimicrobiaceae bacterium]|nr:rRNA (uracil1498-N3)-methyltransferase [Acidimicrobiaceae bacterium]
MSARAPDENGSERSPVGPASVDAAAMVFVDDPSRPVLSRADAHHLTAVLRLRDGEIVVAGDGAGRWARCRIDSGRSPTGPTLVPLGPVQLTAPAEPAVTVAFAPVKGDRPEWVVQKLTELGVDRIVPILTARSVVRWEGDRATKSVERLRRVAQEAAAQCRRAWLPEVAAVSTLGSLAALTGRPTTLACPGGGPPDLDRPVVAIGPEGGWDAAELQAGFDTVGLGGNVLRAETAAVAAGTLLCALRQHLIAPLA